MIRLPTLVSIAGGAAVSLATAGALAQAEEEAEPGAVTVPTEGGDVVVTPGSATTNV